MDFESEQSSGGESMSAPSCEVLLMTLGRQNVTHSSTKEEMEPFLIDPCVGVQEGADFLKLVLIYKAEVRERTHVTIAIHMEPHLRRKS